VAGANVGNLNVKLTLSAEQFSAALIAAGGDVNAFAIKMENVRATTTKMVPATSAAAAGVTKLGGGMSGLGMAMTSVA